MKRYILKSFQPNVDIKSEELAIYNFRILWRHVKTTVSHSIGRSVIQSVSQSVSQSFSIAIYIFVFLGPLRVWL